MYRITSKPKRFKGDYLKTHFCSNYALAQEVVENAEKRYNEYNEMVLSIDSVNQKKFHWDDGGMILAPKKTFRFDLETVVVTCYMHHWSTFQSDVKKRLEDNDRFENKYGNVFYKLHGASTIICLSPRERNTLLKLIRKRKASYDKRAQEVLNNMGA